MQQINNNVPPYTRSTGETIAFWLLWVLFLIPLIFAILLLSDTNGLSILLIPIIVQIAIHAYSAWLFLNKQQAYSKSLMWLLGGTGIIYMIFIGGCFVAVFGLSGNMR
jgi:heme/copper-type cytochrome/quinol oxidase subunit 4